MNTMTSFEILPSAFVSLTAQEIAGLDGGVLPWGIVFGLAGLTATLINVVERNPDTYSSAMWYTSYSRPEGDTMVTLAMYGP